MQARITRAIIEASSFAARAPKEVVAILYERGLYVAEESEATRREWHVGRPGRPAALERLRLTEVDTGWFHPHLIWSGRTIRIHANPEVPALYVLWRNGEWRRVVEVPLICPTCVQTAWAPVYLGTTAEGAWFYLDCMWPSAHLEYPRSAEELGELIRRYGTGFRPNIVIAGRVVEEMEFSPTSPPAAETVMEALRRHLRA